MARQAGVHVGHGHTCQATNTTGQWTGGHMWHTFSNLSLEEEAQDEMSPPHQHHHHQRAIYLRGQ